MTDLPNRPLGSVRPDATGATGATGKAADAASRARAAESADGGVAFRALLERLEIRTRELEAQGRSIEDASGLAGALDAARASLEDAVSLSDRLLEAYRERLLQSGADPDRTSTTDKENRP